MKRSWVTQGSKTPRNYLTKWEKKVCIASHKIRFSDYSGEVMGTCELCGWKEIFPFMG